MQSHFPPLPKFLGSLPILSPSTFNFGIHDHPIRQQHHRNTPHLLSSAILMATTTAESPVGPPQSAHMHSLSRKETYYKPSADEWEAVRLTIRQLYIDENKTLSEVSEILESKYNFHAS